MISRPFTTPAERVAAERAAQGLETPAPKAGNEAAYALVARAFRSLSLRGKSDERRAS